MTEQVIDQPTATVIASSANARPLDDEWLVTNGLSGYASGTISGACTRRYHGLLIAALPVPLGRLMMLNHLSVEIILPDGHVAQLDREELPDDSTTDQAWLGEFQLEAGLPVWHYKVGPYRLEKRVLMPHLQNTVFVTYRLLEGPDRVRLRLRPSIHFRGHDDAVDATLPRAYRVTAVESRFEIESDAAPPLRMRIAAPHAGLLLDGGRFRQVRYRLEKARGYASVGSLWSPGYFRASLKSGEAATLIASTEAWDAILSADSAAAQTAELERRSRLLAEARPEAQQGTAAELVLAADQFLIRPSGRVADEAQAQAAGDEIRSVIAGYHWFTDWGRDTMISLEGLTLMTGRQTEAGYLLRTFARYVRDGLLPNLFPEGKREGLYHTADATLWFFHAFDRYLRASGDTHTLRALLPTFLDIVDHHVRGTRFGIHVDPADGLLSQGDRTLPLTWMDAKVGDWVVTPRRGKAVEINALWYNALCLLENWCRESNEVDAVATLAQRAEWTRKSFNDRFWFADGGYLYDIVDGERGDDTALRPNQVFAISLDHPVLDRARWEPVLNKVTEHLLTPVGLRSLSPDNPDFKAKYDGDLRARDAAYHQGTVWPWLIGPFVDAWLRVHPQDRKTARGFLAAFEPHMNGACVGSISEVFDAESPYIARGCIAQAWSVAEVLRAWVKTEPT
ncbi:MAG TPA: amylo-alpha-1,6-glucosidase [Planctomycetaceae bacterium]|jgi:predicted glycogen debranching enzyme|nr:amylo-alpha-1,6-glucosidase [Planctomycetaceae bacterium]